MTLIEKILFYSLIFFIPFQTRRVLYQLTDSFNEWTSVYLYLTDIILLFLFFLWFWRLKGKRFLKNAGWKWLDRKIRHFGFWLVLFLVLSFVSLVQARSFNLGFYSWLKLFEFILFFFYLKFNFASFFSLRRLSQVLIASGLVQSLIALLQFVNQKSLGLWFLRESPLSVEIDGVAKMATGSFKMIRAYGGLPHPNLLAVFLFLSLFLLIYLWFEKKRSFSGYSLLSAVFFFLFFGLFLTFSRLVIFTFFVSALIYLVVQLKKQKKAAFGLFFILMISSLIVFFSAQPEILSRFQLSSGEQSVSLRSFYNETALSLIRESPFRGVGQGNFVFTLRETYGLLPAWIFQPVHNIYLIIAVEIGLIGLVVFLFFLFRLIFLSIKSKRYKEKKLLLILIFSFLFIGFFDHFFWTLQQGQLIFWLVLGILAGKLSANLTGSGKRV